ncbi:MAG: hypothetical protein ABI083_20435 [Lapillicoccus sp.]
MRRDVLLHLRRGITTIAVLACVLALAPPQAGEATPAVAPARVRLIAPATLHPGEELRSPNGAYRSILQPDGNFVVYAATEAIWSTGTTGSSTRLVMQGDGNLVLYAGSVVLFQTGTSGTKSLAFMQDDGNFVVYGSQRALWSWKTGLIPPPPIVTSVGSRLRSGQTLSVNEQLVSPNRQYRSLMQSDGNVVVSGPTGAIWSTGTTGSSTRLVMQGDGNLVLYAGSVVLFSTGTFGSRPYAMMQDDGNLVLYASDRLQWSSKTGRIILTTFGDGTWVVGSQLPPATYRMRSSAPGVCYWERLRGFSGSLDDIIANDVTAAHDVVTILPSDTGFSSSECGDWSQDLSPMKSGSAPTPDGTWIIGTDMTAGTWSAPGGNSCYWERERDFLGERTSVLDSSFADVAPTVTVAATDKGFATARCGLWTKVG